MKQKLFIFSLILLSSVFFVRYGISSNDNTVDLESEMVSTFIAMSVEICSYGCVEKYNDGCFQCGGCEIVPDYDETDPVASYCIRKQD